MIAIAEQDMPAAADAMRVETVDSSWDESGPQPARPRLVSLFAAAPGLSAAGFLRAAHGMEPVPYTHPRAHEHVLDLVSSILL